MKSVSIGELINEINKYDSTMIFDVMNAYNYARDKHKNQYRESGEEYIVHPLTVAYILATMKADKDTICASLLHDVLEDTDTSKEDIEFEFGKTVAELVDGVTKLSRVNFESKKERNYANTRKIILSITSDVRVVLIKLADRLHNMSTLSFKNPEKQQEIARETMEIFVPLAYNIGAYKMKCDLEDLSFKYIDKSEYDRIQDETNILLYESNEFLKEMVNKIHKILLSEHIPNQVKVRIRNLYGIYKKRRKGQKLKDIHDLLALKVIVDEVADCYLSLGLVHSLYKPINSKFKDYIANPKTNMYQCLHTTVFGPKDSLVQTQIRTNYMDKIDTFGLAAYWDLNPENASTKMQEIIETRSQFYKSLVELDKEYENDQEFVEHVKKELFSGNVYVYTTEGKVIQLPVGSSAIDFAYLVDPEGACKLREVYVNDKKVHEDYILHNKDRVRIRTDRFSFPREEWKNKVKTTRALSLIRRDL